MESFAYGTVLVDRDDEVRHLKDAVRQVVQGRGAAVWIDGEAGIGKSALLAAGLAGAEELGCQVLRATADEFAQRCELRVVLDCLGITPNSPDPDQRAISDMLSGAGADPPAAATERLLVLIEDMCTTTPVIMVIDDMQWADPASLVVWHRLGRMIRRLPLLLIAACGPVPHRPDLALLRRDQTVMRNTVIALGPLCEAATAELAGQLLDADAVGSALRQILQGAAGNPCYVHAIVNSLQRDGHLTRLADNAVELTSELARMPESLTTAISAQLRHVSGSAWEVLRMAALLGPAFSATELSAMSGRSVTDLVGVLEEGIASGVLVEFGAHLKFRHTVVRQALYENIPKPIRVALHNQAARALAPTGARIEFVAEHLLAALPGDAAIGIDEWGVDWLLHNAHKLVHRASEPAVDLLTLGSNALEPDDPRRQPLRIRLTEALLLLGRTEEAGNLAEGILAEGIPTEGTLAGSRDPEITAETSWFLAWSLNMGGRVDKARIVAENAIGAGKADRTTNLASRWTARLHGLRARITLSLGQVETAETAARRALDIGRQAGDPFAIGLALHVTGLISAQRRDLARAAADFDRALSELGNSPESTDQRLLILVDLRGVLFELGKVDKAEETVQEMQAIAQRSGTSPKRGVARPCAAEHLHATGRWDEAVAELKAAMECYDRMSAPQQSRLRCLAAVIAGHRDQRDTMEEHLAAVPESPDRYTELALLAQATLCERDGRQDDAAAALDAALARDEHPGTRHAWLPLLVRLALALDDRDTALRATEACEADTVRGSAPAIAAAARHCRGMLEGDPALIDAVVEAYRRLDQPPKCAQALEDSAVLHARNGDLGVARAAYLEATRIYTDLGANWDLQRADARLRPHGMRRLRVRRRNATTGWEALTPTELRVARLVAAGHANADIAATLFASRRTIEVHVSRILAKLGARSRVEIAIEATRQPGIDQHTPRPIRQKDRLCG
ncbi:ATP-binding protein [Saccharopolyspora hattusasensis]|uniref:ATP-binding protein n=1 Tax=Saccharopolyspora hattusasensis TaxID=1128679 RepID=UPI003D99166D